MLTLLAFIFERFVTSLPDMLMLGGGAYLAARGGKRAAWGIGLMALYGMAIAGIAMAGELGKGPFAFGPVFGVLSAIGFGWLGWRKTRRAAVTASAFSEGGGDRSV
ncbi:hypothetical protein [Brevundimonas sp. TWP2-3-4b1]|uniref:hypothetical protein n=1 Tax=Brevundimonas sp. TWP2-3-4b1 TaxID=2804580 RepID=UPI003CF32304